MIQPHLGLHHMVVKRCDPLRPERSREDSSKGLCPQNRGIKDQSSARHLVPYMHL